MDVYEHEKSDEDQANLPLHQDPEELLVIHEIEGLPVIQKTGKHRSAGPFENVDDLDHCP